MTAIEATFSSDQLSLLSRIGRGLEHLIALRYPPLPGDGAALDDRPDDETMVQVALICSAHF
jgi:hypothetical protein